MRSYKKDSSRKASACKMAKLTNFKSISVPLASHNNAAFEQQPSGDFHRQSDTNSSNSNRSVQASPSSPRQSSEESSLPVSMSACKASLQSTLSAGSTALASEHFKVEWRDLDVVVRSKWHSLTSQRAHILSSLDGSFSSGQLTAILGPSGAGKSTLVDCLTGTKRAASLAGSTRVSFASAAVEARRRTREPLKIAIIPQADNLLQLLTVAETLNFASRIKNAANASFDHASNVSRVMQQLSLTQCATTRCGKLSGGQNKRVSIAQELLSSPDILMLDEPTSGLDSITCYNAVGALRQLLAQSPKPLAIVATIHQPDVEMFELFDKTYVLAGQPGRAVFEGPVAGILPAIRRALCDVRDARRSSPSLLVAVDGCCPTKTLDTSRKSGEKEHHQDDEQQPVEETKLGDPFARLERALDSARCNPARLIVELATGAFGLELVGALNTIQRGQHSQQQEASVAGLPFRCAGQTLQQPDTGAPAPVALYSTTPNGALPAQQLDEPAGGLRKQMELTNMQQQQQQETRSNDAKQRPVLAPVFDYEKFAPSARRPQLDKLLCLGAQRPNGAPVFWQHLSFHTHRSWLTIVRDPMLCSVQVMLHILVPLLLSYCFQLHSVDACPRVEPFDLIEEAYSPKSLIDDVNNELRLALEAQGYFFIQLYVIIFAAICGYALTYPLAMRVLVKEYRNGWYSASSYFCGRTLADLPICSFNVVLAVCISYYLTGQAHSDYEWRFASLAALTVLATLVAQTQGLLFGALLMNSPQSAVFVAPASTAPLVVVCGFLLRLQSMPAPLQLASKLSYFTHLMSGALISRYGFNRCQCNETALQVALKPASGGHSLPEAARSLIDMWVDTFATEYALEGAAANVSSGDEATPDLTGKLLGIVERAQTFGFQVRNCSQVKPFSLLDAGLQDSQLAECFYYLIAMLLGFRLLTYMTLRWRLNKSL